MQNSVLIPVNSRHDRIVRMMQVDFMQMKVSETEVDYLCSFSEHEETDWLKNKSFIVRRLRYNPGSVSAVSVFPNPLPEGEDVGRFINTLTAAIEAHLQQVHIES